MELAQALLDAILSVSLAKLLGGVAAVMLICIALGWQAWKRDSLDRLADNVLGAQALANITLFALSLFLLIDHYGLLYGLAVGLWLSLIVALILGYLFRWFVTLSIFFGTWLAQLLGVPQTGSVFNDPAVLAKLGAFLRKSRSKQ